MDEGQWDGTTETAGSASTPGETTTGPGSPSPPSTTGTAEPPDSTASPWASDTTESTFGSWGSGLADLGWDAAAAALSAASGVLATVVVKLDTACTWLDLTADRIRPPRRQPLWPEDDA